MAKRKKTEGRNGVDLLVPRGNSTGYEKPDDNLVSFERDLPLLPSITQSSNITMAAGTRKSDPKKNIMGSYEGLTDPSKESTNRLAKVFPGFTMHSGYRSKERSDKGKLSGYRLAGKAGLTSAQLKAGPATPTKPSPHRKSGIEALRQAGFVSKHEKGDAIDFSYKDYPKSLSKADKLKIINKVKKHFPSAKVLPKKGHVHMVFGKRDK
jgi:hypothetical protein